MISSYLIAIIAAWVVAQGTKYVVKAVKEKSFRHVRQLYLSGNMPSAHSASVMALLVTIGWIDGVDSAVFAVAALFCNTTPQQGECHQASTQCHLTLAWQIKKIKMNCNPGL